MDDEDRSHRCRCCGKGFRNPGSLATHLTSCDVNTARELHEERARHVRELERAAQLALITEQEDLEEEHDVEETDEEVEAKILALMEQQGTESRFREAALQCTEFRETMFMPEVHVQKVKAVIAGYCESGVKAAAARVARKFHIPEVEVEKEIATCFQDYRNLEGKKQEKKVADTIIGPVQPSVRVLGTRRDEKGNLIEVWNLIASLFISIISDLHFTSHCNCRTQWWM